MVSGVVVRKPSTGGIIAKSRLYCRNSRWYKNVIQYSPDPAFHLVEGGQDYGRPKRIFHPDITTYRRRYNYVSLKNNYLCDVTQKFRQHKLRRNNINMTHY